MTIDLRAPRSAASTLLPAATAALALGIFVADAITAEKLAVSVFFVVVVLLAARFNSARLIVLVGAGCVGLTVLAFLLPGVTEPPAPGIKASISLAVIVLTTFLVTERQRSMEGLRNSEQQWREVFEHNPVMYFMVSPTGTVLSVNAFGAAQLGYSAADLIGQSVLTVFFEEEREFVRAQLATCAKELGHPRSWEIRKVRKDGTGLWVRENAKAVPRSGNEPIVLIACEDITERRRGEQRVEAQSAVTRVLAEADSLATAAPEVLQAIGENLEWDWGALWRFDWERDRDAAPLRCDVLWRAPGIETTEFDTVSREWIFGNGEGLVGQVWRTGKPIWMIDATSEPGFLRAPAAAQVGLHGAVIFPIMLDTEPLGVVEFFSRGARERDEEQLATLSAIGSQLGQFIKRQRAEEGLRAGEERWRKLFETSSAGMALFQLDGLCTAANPALQRMLSRTEAEIVGHNVLELNHEDERAATAEALVRYRAGTLTERNVEKKYLKKEGSPVWLNITNTLVPAIETAPPFLQAVYVDITRRVEAETALRASEERWRLMFETSAAGIATASLDGVFTAANPALRRMLDRTEDEIVGHTAIEISHEDDRTETEDVVAKFRSGLQQEYHVEKRYLKKDGSPVWLNVTTTLVPGTETAEPFLQAIYIDISDRKRAETALRASEERWRAMVETAPVGITMLDFEHRRYLAANAAFQRMTGYTEDDLRQLTALEVTHEDDRRAVQRRIDTGIIGGQQKRYRRKDGGVIWADVSAFVVPATESTPAFLGTVVVDITERKRAEDALRRSEALLNEVFVSLPDGLAIVGRDYRYQRVNRANALRSGLAPEQIAGMQVADLIDAEAFNENVKAGLDRCFAGEHVTYSRWFKYKVSGRQYTEVSYSPLYLSGLGQPNAVLVLTRDLTEFIQASEALQQAQADLARLNRVMLLDEMAASIAHEVNQPIAAVVTNASAGLRWLGARQPDLEEVRQALGRIVRDGTRAGEVIARIRALVKKAPPRRDELDINQAIHEVLALTQTEMQRHNVRLQRRLADDLPLVSADRIQLQQVVMNLVVNAIEAMAGAAVGQQARGLTIVSGKDDDGQVFVDVQDTGPGIDPEQLDRLFQSFYTTKPDGIGMGLAISRSIAEAHGGRLSAAPNKPRGAIFRLTLPVENGLAAAGTMAHSAERLAAQT
jgi:PAS domain S-box-containing protein